MSKQSRYRSPVGIRTLEERTQRLPRALISLVSAQFFPGGVNRSDREGLLDVRYDDGTFVLIKFGGVTLDGDWRVEYELSSCRVMILSRRGNVSSEARSLSRLSLVNERLYTTCCSEVRCNKKRGTEVREVSLTGQSCLATVKGLVR
eukprot:CCRYP_015570-RA/>CCRYP_015570-RA protein AED:0.45 eAED:0.60 QI:0/0/0.33/1/0/0/3/322/146